MGGGPGVCFLARGLSRAPWGGEAWMGAPDLGHCGPWATRGKPGPSPPSRPSGAPGSRPWLLSVPCPCGHPGPTCYPGRLLRHTLPSGLPATPPVETPEPHGLRALGASPAPTGSWGEDHALWLGIALTPVAGGGSWPSPCPTPAVGGAGCRWVGGGNR